MNKIDAHIHYVDFNQESDGFESLLKSMDKSDIEKAVIFGLPVKKKWAYHERYKPSYYLDGYSHCYYYSQTDEIVAHHYQQLSPEDQSRFALLLCGFDPTDRSSIAHVKYMFEKYPFLKGVGELLMRHDELSLHTTAELPRINHPCLDDIFELCKNRKLPVLFHHNATSVGYEHNPIYVHEIEETLERHSQVQFVWAHIGASARTTNNSDYWKSVKGLLEAYNNLAVDISWKVYDDEICNDGIPKQEYVDLINEFPNRFMIGTDLAGHFEDQLSIEINKFDSLLNILPRERAVKVASENARRIYFQETK